MGWPTFRIDIEGFDGWYAEVTVPSVGEVKELSDAVDTNSYDAIVNCLVPTIVEWNVTDRDGAVLEPTVDGFLKAPSSIIHQILSKVMEAINKEPIPKAKTSTKS